MCVGGWVVVLRDHNSLFLGAFAQNLNTNSAFNAEVLGAITAIDIATEKNWTNLWLETDSKHVTLAFKNKEMVPWSLGNRWLNCLDDIKQMNFLISHVYREGNSCADSLANVGLALSLFVWFPSLPDCIRKYYITNRLGMPNRRFVYFWEGFDLVPPLFLYLLFLFIYHDVMLKALLFLKKMIPINSIYIK